MNLLSLIQNWRRWTMKQRDNFLEKDVEKEQDVQSGEKDTCQKGGRLTPEEDQQNR
jgi:hypothetical protein